MISSSDLLILSRPPFSLISLACTVDLSPSSRLFLGVSLQSLTLRLDGQATTAPVINEAIVTISRLPVLEKLQLWLPSFFPEVSFAPLAAASQLQELRFYAVNDGADPTHAQLDQLRMLPHLRRLEVDLSRGSFLHVLRAPHSLQWQAIRPVNRIDDELAAALSTLPTLTELDAWDCGSVAFLPSFSRLRRLQLYMHPTVRLAADISAGLACCSQLTELSLLANDVTSQHLSQALPHLPELCSLEVMCCSSLVSLSFLSECGHLSHSLQSLCLCGSYPPVAHSTEFQHILTLKSLTHLICERFFVEALDASMLQALTAPCSV